MILPENLAATGSESGHQKALMAWAATCGKPELKLLFAIPNGGKRDKLTAARMKAEGARSGVPDLFLPVARGGFHGLFIELKTSVGKASSAQEQWLAALSMQGYATFVAYGWEDAKVILENYLEL